MLIIPAIDIINGKVTRLIKGNFEQRNFYEGFPIDYAIKFDAIGLKWLHLVDLSASISGNISLLEIIREIKSSTKLKIQFGGGIKSFINAEKVFDSGVDRIVIGSISVTAQKEFEKIHNKYGSDKIIVASDINNEMIYIKGWTEKSNVSLWNHLDYCTSLGIKYILCTDISKDGTLYGPNLELYKEVIEKYPQVNLIASGGISSNDDLIKLKDNRLYAAIIGKAIYENKIALEELEKFVS